MFMSLLLINNIARYNSICQHHHPFKWTPQGTHCPNWWSIFFFEKNVLVFQYVLIKEANFELTKTKEWEENGNEDGKNGSLVAARSVSIIWSKQHKLPSPVSQYLFRFAISCTLDSINAENKLKESLMIVVAVVVADAVALAATAIQSTTTKQTQTV